MQQAHYPGLQERKFWPLEGPACSVKYHAIKPWREEWLKKASQYSRITSSKVRNDATQQSQAETPGACMMNKEVLDKL